MQMVQGYNWEKNEPNMWPAMLFHGNVKAHVYKSASQNKKFCMSNMKYVKQVFNYKIYTPTQANIYDNKKAKYSYINVSANDDIKWKKADTNRWEFSDKFE